MRKKIQTISFWILGFSAFIWIVLRTGSNPKRLTYPCQQAAFPLASSWLLSIIAFITGSFFLRKFVKLSSIIIITLGSIWFILSLYESPSAAENKMLSSLPTWEVQNPISTVFVMDSIPPTIGSLASGDASVPDSCLVDPAIDTLLMMMEKKNIYLHKTTAKPIGIVDTNDVVIIKGNFQWNSRNTTSTDRIKGLIWQILQHPDGFTGEILVCDNTQEIGTGINDNDNNSEDQNQSIVDVVNTFYAKGYPVYRLDWNYIWSAVVNEYSDGNLNNGYVYESSTKISYPKFRSPSNNYFISLRYGIWDSLTQEYNQSRLCIIDFPVLKAHSIAGATISIKNWVGVLTTAHYTDRYGGRTAMHNTYFMGSYALVARVMAVTFPKLTIVDAAWTTTYGPSSLTFIQNTKMLAASTDPIAASWYTAKYILTPIALYPNNTNPDLPGSAYKNSLTNWTTFLHDSAGYPCTKDSSKISVYNRNILFPVIASFSPTNINFGNVSIDSTKQNIITIYNIGSSNLVISSIISTNQNFITQTDSLTVPPFDSSNIAIDFSPTEIGTQYGYIILDHNGISDIDSVSVSGIGMPTPTTLSISYSKGWNIISVPLIVDNYNHEDLYPTSISNAYTFEVNGYVLKDTLKNNIGYWLKFDTSSTLNIIGWDRNIDTIVVRKGWNLVGTVSNPITMNDITHIPDGIIMSKFFTYLSGYKGIDTLFPGKGYWVKVSDNGIIILTSNKKH